jgi:hypothetical protein
LKATAKANAVIAETFAVCHHTAAAAESFHPALVFFDY